MTRLMINSVKIFGKVFVCFFSFLELLSFEISVSNGAKEVKKTIEKILLPLEDNEAQDGQAFSVYVVLQFCRFRF